MKLYELTKEFDEAIKKWQETEENSEEESSLDSSIEKLGLSIDEKLDNICSYRKSLLAEAEALKAEASKLLERKKTAENKAERLKTYLNTCIEPGDKWKNSRHAIGWRKSEAVEVTDESLVPEDYKKISISIDKMQAKKDLSLDKIIPGLQLVSKLNIQLK